MRFAYSIANELFNRLLHKTSRSFACLISVTLPLICSGGPRQLHGQDSSALANPLQLTPDHVTASVADLQKEEQWYVQVLGFKETNHIHPRSDFEACRVSVPGFSVDLVQQKGSRKSKKNEGNLEQGWLHVVFKTATIEKAYAALQEAKTDVKAESDARGLARLVVHDPEGNEIEIFAR